MENILVIDDNNDICTLLKSFLSRKGFKVEVAFTGREGLNLLEKTNYDVVLCDYRLPDKDGLEMIDSIKQINSSTRIIIITGYSDVNLAVKSIKKGAYEYVTKPIMPDEIITTINKAIQHTNVIDSEIKFTKKRKKIREDITSGKSNDEVEIVKGTGVKSKQLNKLIKLVAPTKMTVMIIGESGTGKEVTSQLIHNKSKRSKKPFVAVDCGAIPKELAGSELFGHKKGSFTGALQDKKGVFEVADGGTLFLDEIANLSYDNQVKLLRVIQERKVKAIGSEKEVKVDVRIIVATNEDLKAKVARKEFREDLYFRVNEFRIDLLPLRERQADLPEFVEYFLAHANNELEKDVSEISDEVMEIFREYSFPGNIRELKNLMKRSVLMVEGNKLTKEHIPQEIQNSIVFDNNEITVDQGYDNLFELKAIVEIAEKNAILKSLVKTNYNKSKAAKLLNVDRKTLYNKIDQYGIELYYKEGLLEIISKLIIELLGR